MSLLKEETLSRKLIKQWFRVYFFALLIAPTGYIFRVVLSQEFDVATVGVFYSVVSLMTVLTMYNDLWLSHSLKYFLPIYYLNKKFWAMKTSFVITLFIQLSTAFAIILFLFWWWAEWLALHHFHSELALPMLRIMMWYFVGINLYEVLTIVMRSFQDVWNDNISYFLRMWSTTIVVVFFFFFHVDSLSRYVTARVWWLFLGLIYALYVFFKNYWWTFSQWSFSLSSVDIRSYFRYAVRIFLWSNAGILMSHIDQQMVVNMLWDFSAWIYANYLSLFNAFNYLVWPLIGILFPIIVELNTKWEKTKMEMLYWLFFNYIFILSLVWALFFLVFWPNIASVLFGADFVASWFLLRFAAVFLPFFTINSICAAILSSTGRLSFYVKITLLASLSNIILNYFLIRHLGLYGSVISTMFNWSLVTFVSYIEIKRDYCVTWQFSLLLKNFLGLLLLWSFLYWFFYLSPFFVWTGIIYTDSLLLWLIALFVASFFVVLNWRTLLLLYREVRFLRS